jgi:hypothetical protein
MGKSATTVTAGPKTIAKGGAVLIEGTVLDMSPAQSGTPCVSKDSMSIQMEYLHLQQPIDGIWGNETIEGVPVYLTAIDENDDVHDLGQVTTNGYYGTFAFAWTPPEEGTYTIMASFNGDESYGSSSAATAVHVGPAPEGPQPVEPDTHPLVTTEVAIIIAVVVVAVIGLAAYWMFRKRQ